MSQPQVTEVKINGEEGVFIKSGGNVYFAMLTENVRVVHHIAVTFDQPVTLANYAVAAVVTNVPVTVVSGEQQPVTAHIGTAMSPLAGSGGKTWIVRFSMIGVTGGPVRDNGNLPQGVFNVTIRGPIIRNNDGTATMAADFNIVVPVLYGSRHEGNQLIVDAAQEALWQQQFNANIGSPGTPIVYDPTWDNNLDGWIDGTEFAQLVSNLGTVWQF